MRAFRNDDYVAFTGFVDGCLEALPRHDDVRRGMETFSQGEEKAQDR